MAHLYASSGLSRSAGSFEGMLKQLSARLFGEGMGTIRPEEVVYAVNRMRADPVMQPVLRRIDKGKATQADLQLVGEELARRLEPVESRINRLFDK